MFSPAPSTSPLKDVLRHNVEAVRTRIQDACARAGRSASAVQLVCVTKAFPLEVVRALLQLDIRDLGENRVAQLRDRQLEFAPYSRSPAPVRWHMIGHLQRRKAATYLTTGAFLHSLESERLLTTLERHLRASPEPSAPLDVLVEVSVAGEEQKQGLTPEAVPAFLDRVGQSSYVRAVGLMCMAPRHASAEELRRVFAKLRELRDVERANHPQLRELSMGMSGDFEVACEEGATIVRIGSALAEGLPA